jgi:hypothetical protein
MRQSGQVRCHLRTDQTTPYAPVPIGLMSLYFLSTSNLVPHTRKLTCWRDDEPSGATCWATSA